MTTHPADCDICRGTQIISLPRYSKVMSTAQDEITEPVNARSREFPCPNCSPVADEARVTVFYAETDVPAAVLAQRPEIRESVRDTHARMLSASMSRAGFVDLKHIETRERRDYRGGAAVMRSRVGVVAPAVVASIEQRAVEAAGPIVIEVVRHAVMSIGIWGSHYNATSIRKEDAERFIREAAKHVLDKHRERIKPDGEQVRTEKKAGPSGADRPSGD